MLRPCPGHDSRTRPASAVGRQCINRARSRLASALGAGEDAEDSVQPVALEFDLACARALDQVVAADVRRHAAAEAVSDPANVLAKLGRPDMRETDPDLALVVDHEATAPAEE